jgi:hypothetical protein
MQWSAGRNRRIAADCKSRSLGEELHCVNCSSMAFKVPRTSPQKRWSFKQQSLNELQSAFWPCSAFMLTAAADCTCDLPPRLLFATTLELPRTPGASHMKAKSAHKARHQLASVQASLSAAAAAPCLPLTCRLTD